MSEELSFDDRCAAVHRDRRVPWKEAQRMVAADYPDLARDHFLGSKAHLESMGVEIPTALQENLALYAGAARPDHRPPPPPGAPSHSQSTAAEIERAIFEQVAGKASAPAPAASQSEKAREAERAIFKQVATGRQEKNPPPPPSSKGPADTTQRAIFKQVARGGK